MRAGLVILALSLGCQGGSAADRPQGKLELIEAPAAADLLPVIAGEVARANADGKRLLVYVGASWCEPCVRFHDAAARGELDATFPDLRLLVLDEDRDHDALAAAGYDSKMIPLFAEANADGTPTGRSIQGSVKGEAAVAEITPRLRGLLAPQSGR